MQYYDLDTFAKCTEYTIDSKYEDNRERKRNAEGGGALSLLEDQQLVNHIL